MLLEKWYGDWISPEGPHVLYSASLSLGPFAMSFDGGYAPGGTSRGRFRSGKAPLPILVDGTLRWPADDGVFVWESAAPRPMTLRSINRGAVTWDVVVPSGRVTGPNIAPGQIGYAERLALRVAPWRLGIETLRWGRFCGRSSSLAWVEWLGMDPVAISLLDGHPVRLREASLERVIADGVELTIEITRPFVESALGEGLLRTMPWPSRIRPLAFLSGIERKYAGRGLLHRQGSAPEDGDVLLEEVHWPR